MPSEILVEQPFRLTMPQVESRGRLQRSAMWLFNHWQKIVIYTLVIGLGGAFAATTLGIGLLYSTAIALATPAVMELNSIMSNAALNWLFPSRRPRNSADPSNTLIMTAALAMTISLGLGVSWSAGVFFLSPLVINGMASVTTKAFFYLFPGLRMIANEYERGETDLTRTHLFRLIETNNHTAALSQIDRLDMQNTTLLLDALEECIIRQNTVIFNRLIAIDAVHPFLHQNNNALLVRSCYQGQPEMVNALLRHQRVRHAANSNHNEALRYACRQGHLEVVNALLGVRCVLSEVTYNHNEAYRIARQVENQRIWERLLQVNAVANYDLPENTEYTITLREGPPSQTDRTTLRAMAADTENSMRPLTAQQNQTLDHFRQRYTPIIQARGLEVIVQEIKDYLARESDRKPVKFNKQPLARDFSTGSTAQKKAQYRDDRHTAYRYFCLAPNPWIHPHANFTRELAGGRAACIGPAEQEKICLMWLAVNDRTRPLPKNFNQKGMKKEFTAILADMARGHNRDNGGDDAGPDKPTCSMGVQQRAVQLFTLYLLDGAPEERPLNLAIILQKFKEELITTGNNPNSLFAKLERLSVEELNAFDDNYQDWVMEGCIRGTDNPPALEAILRPMDPSTADVDAFIELCKNYFGEQRITNTGQNIIHVNQQYQSYEQVIRKIAETSLGDFGTDINNKIIALKNPRQKSHPEKLRKDKTVTFSERAKAASDKNKKSPAKKSAPSYHARPQARRCR